MAPAPQGFLHPGRMERLEALGGREAEAGCREGVRLGCWVPPWCLPVWLRPFIKLSEAGWPPVEWGMRT